MYNDNDDNGIDLSDLATSKYSLNPKSAPDIDLSKVGSDSNSTSTPSKNFSAADIKDLFKSAREDLQKSKDMGVSKEDLDSLNKHQAANMWGSLFMNLIGAAGHVDATPYMKPLTDRINQEASNLSLKNKLAQSGIENAMAQQRFGMGELGANQALNQQDYMNATASPVSQASLAKTANIAGIHELQLPENMTNQQAEMFLNQLTPTAKLGLEQQRIDAMKNMYENRGEQLVKNEKSGQYEIVNKLTGERKPVGRNSFSQPSQQDQGNKQSINFNDLTSGQNNLTPNEQRNTVQQLEKLSSNYEKNYGIPDMGFKDSMNKLDKIVGDASKGNYIAASSLPIYEAKILDGLNQRLTNYDIQLMNDPTSKGIVTSLQGKIQGVLGEGRMTPTDAKNIKEMMESLKAAHEHNIQAAQNFYRTKASSLVKAPFKDDEYLFGQSDMQSQPMNNSLQQQTNSILNKNVIHADDYLNSLGK